MSLTVVAALLVVGVAVGILSGLIGIGGGVLMVPFLYFFYAHPEWSGFPSDPGVQAAVAHATSLFIMVPTAVWATVTYHRARLVAWRAALPITATALLAAVVGARIAILLPAPLLKFTFGLFLLLVGADLLRPGWRSAAPRSRAGALPLAALAGVVVGLYSAILGLGGGLVAIPVLIHLVGLDLRRVAATSIAVVAFTALAGAGTYVASGWGDPGLPDGSWGYVHVLPALPILAASLLTVGMGARLNQRLPARLLARVFGVAVIALGVLLVVQNAGEL